MREEVEGERERERERERPPISAENDRNTGHELNGREYRERG